MKKQLTKQNQAKQAPVSVAEVFSQTRDINSENPYHMDGDIEMYSEQNIKLRQQIKNDPDLNKHIDQFLDMYPWIQNESLKLMTINEQQYKKYQSLLAVILRSDIDEEELKFTVDQDWELDRQKSEKEQFYISKQKMRQNVFELIDVWTSGVSKEQYISFCKLLKKKLDRALKNIKQ